MNRPTRKEKVLRELEWQAPYFDGWIDGHRLCLPDIGGSEGLRRLRELRTDGVEIEKRLKPGRPRGSTVYQYRLKRPTQDTIPTLDRQRHSGCGS